VLVGAWGQRASELLERPGGHREEPIHRIGQLAMPGAPHISGEDWCVWMFGAPQDRGQLGARFGSGPECDLPGAFGRALLELGDRACELLFGRFVVVALNRQHDRCLVVRDQLGAQPLVYTQVANGILFAEHERDLLDLLDQAPSPDRLALQQWIESGTTPAGRTHYDGVRRLPAGHRLALDHGHTRVEQWWSLRYEGVEQADAAELAERVREGAFAAVWRAASGAEHLAVKLSGGLDSACVAAGLAASGSTNGRTLAIAGAFPDHPVTDESELIEATACHTHLALEVVTFNPASSILSPALEHIDRWRLPPATPNLFLWQPLMVRARELGVDRMLDGEGGDELFGLAPYLIAEMLRKGRLGAAWSLAGRVPGVGPDARSRIRLRVLRRIGPKALLPSLVRHHREKWRRTVSSRSIIPRADALTLADLQIHDGRQRREGPMWWRFLAESLIDERDLLDVGAHFRREAADERIDRRHPFLYDLPLTEAMLRIPPQAQFDPIRDRPLLRDGLSGRIPEMVRTRHTKSHFTPLLLEGIRAEEGALIAPLRQPSAPIRAYVVAEALERKVAVAPQQRLMLGAGPLWRLAIANQWLLSHERARR
jgi:asparagine synthetase B (glutamine-hydrolysing)